MRLQELYPLWDDVHQRLLETLDYLTEAQVEYRPVPAAESIADIVMRFIREERWWIGVIVAGYEEYRPLEKEHRCAGALIEAIRVTREITRRTLEPLSPEGMRAVRTVPADPARNRHETNMPISRIVWNALENEMVCWGQVQLRLADAKLLMPPRDPRRN